LSDYDADKENKKFASQSVIEADKATGEVVKETIIHIHKPENVGEKMCIDEKMIGNRYCTLMSNADTGKLALLVESMNPAVIKEAISKFGTQAQQKVEHICSDMSPMFKKICRELYPKASLSVDKFHVIKQVLDALQAVRIEEKNQLKKEESQSEITTQGWTKLELLEKSKYLLMKQSITWTEEETDISKLLFKHFPTLEKAYKLVEMFRQWYERNNDKHPRWWLEKTLGDWLEQVEQAQIKQFKFIKKMVEKHEAEIINYFEKGHTNAKAENLNAKIQRFIIGNYGLRNKEFFYYRLQVYFT
jgi:transposase